MINIYFFSFSFTEKLLNSSGRELRRALFSLKQIFQVIRFDLSTSSLCLNLLSTEHLGISVCCMIGIEMRGYSGLTSFLGNFLAWIDDSYCDGIHSSLSLVQSPAQPLFFLRNDNSHCNRIHSTVAAVLCFDNSYVGKQPVAWREYCGEYCLTLLKSK